MLISHQKRFILMAPWKTASQSLHAALEKYNDSVYDRHFHFNDHLNRIVHQHITFTELLTLPESRLDYTTGTFVRNPYDRCFSGFLQIQRDFQVQPRMQFEPHWVGALVREQIGQNMQRVIEAGFDFDRWFDALPDYEFFDIGRNSNFPLYPAYYWTNCHENRVDFVGKVENMPRDFHRFCELIGVEGVVLEDHNSSRSDEYSPHQYSRYAGRMARRSIERINEIFQKDFDYFEYENI